jgi:hypothetical protein
VESTIGSHGIAIIQLTKPQPIFTDPLVGDVVRVSLRTSGRTPCPHDRKHAGPFALRLHEGRDFFAPLSVD